MTDLTKTIEPKSDQLNVDDFIGDETKTITIVGVKVLETDQPIELHSNEYPGRPFKPGLTARRVLIGIWGKSAAGWEGRSLTLFVDREVMFGRQKVGGIRVSHASHIDGPKTLNLTVTRGKRAPFTVQPLATYAVDDAEGWLNAAQTLPELQQMWGEVQRHGFATVPEIIALKNERKVQLDDGVA